MDLQKEITAYAVKQLEFDDCRFIQPWLNQQDKEAMHAWLKNNYHGDMDYLERHVSFKEQPELLLNNVQSSIVVIKNYRNNPQKHLNNKFKIARYAVGKDYHLILGEQIKRLVQKIKSLFPAAECYFGVDSSPLAERSLAINAGIGFLGKNTMVIKPGLGSYFFIGVILTTIKLQNNEPAKVNGCGTCTRCIDACPTDAFVGEYTLDANKCISYLTIEKKEPLENSEIAQLTGWIFGCDICQEVCPYNHSGNALTDWPAFRPDAGIGFNYFDHIGRNKATVQIPKDSPLHRSRRRVIPNFKKVAANS